MAFCWRADDGPFIVVFGFSIPLSTKKGELIKFGAPLTKLSGSDSAHGLTYIGLSNTILFALTAQILVTSRDGISTQEYRDHTCFFMH